jgi:hypothetical protein
MEVQRSGDLCRPMLTLLGARIRLYRGDAAGARGDVGRIRAEQTRESLPSDAKLSPSDDVLCAMIELATSDASEAAWSDLVERSTRLSFGQEHLEVLEAHALAALRRGDAKEAQRRLETTIVAAARIPNVMGPRLARQLAQARAIVDAAGDLNH